MITRSNCFITALGIPTLKSFAPPPIPKGGVFAVVEVKISV